MATIERLSTTQEYNLSRQPRATLERERDDIMEKHDIDVNDFFRNDYESSSEDKTLSGQPIEDAVRLIAWAYSTPTKAIISTSAIFVGGIHFGWFSLPVAIATGLKMSGLFICAKVFVEMTYNLFEKVGKKRKPVKG